MSRRLFSTLVILGLALFSLAPAPKEQSRPGFAGRPPQHFYVAPNGDDNNPGIRAKPFRTIQYGVDQLNPGDTLTVLGGTYRILHEVVITVPGGGGTTVIEGERDNPPVLDAREGYFPWNRDHMRLPAVIEIRGSENVLLRNFTVRNSHFGGIHVVDSRNVDVVNCKVESTLASGIATWPGCEGIRVLGNTVIDANDTTLSWGPYRWHEAPHEAISIISTRNFEVAYNLLIDCQKEGVDVKGESAHGTVHHNYFCGVLRQGLYVDSWRGVLEDVELHHNVVTHGGWGVAVSTEGGIVCRNVRIHHNIFDHCQGPGVFISRWGLDNKREDIRIWNNTIYHNGMGKPDPGWRYYWLVGGFYLYTTHVEGLDFRNNILSHNDPFELGYTFRLLPEDFAAKRIELAYNLINAVKAEPGPIYLAKWAKDTVRTTLGKHAVTGDPLFVDPEHGDFRLRPGSPAVDAGDPDPAYRDPDGSRCDIGAIPLGASEEEVFWWKKNFPPEIRDGKPVW